MKLFKTKWGEWTDISTGYYACRAYLIQSRRHKNGKIKFRVAVSNIAINCESPSIDQLKDVKHENT